MWLRALVYRSRDGKDILNTSKISRSNVMTHFPADLTQDEIRCLNRHQIPVSQLFDLRGLSAQDPNVRRAMEETDTYFGYNGSSCSAGKGHRLVTRYGHCMQCEHTGPRSIGELKNRMGSGEVYIAGSLIARCLKVGSTRDSLKRIQSLNSQSYGNAADWRRLLYVKDIKRHADLEHKIQTALAQYRLRNISYDKSGAEQLCAELFLCSIRAAQKALTEHMPKDCKIHRLVDSELLKYDFGSTV